MFVFPSLYEGFGLPMLEAMNLGVPVIASNTASLPEVGGDACIYFDPNSATELSEKMSILIDNTEKRKEMIKLGKIRSEIFSWEKAAYETLQVYNKIFE